MHTDDMRARVVEVTPMYKDAAPGQQGQVLHGTSTIRVHDTMLRGELAQLEMNEHVQHVLP